MVAVAIIFPGHPVVDEIISFLRAEGLTAYPA
jgi:hypothetical protein